MWGSALSLVGTCAVAWEFRAGQVRGRGGVGLVSSCSSSSSRSSGSRRRSSIIRNRTALVDCAQQGGMHQNGSVHK